MKIYTNDLVKGHSDFKVKCLTFGLYTQVSDSGPLGPLVVLNPLKSNWHLAASCQLPIYTNRRISIWLPFAGFLYSFYCFKPSQIELASGCQLPVANSHKQAN